MQIEVVPLPTMLEPSHLEGRAVVVLDVLRATTTIAAGLAAGAREICVFESIDAVRRAARDRAGEDPPPLLCGEVRTVRPDGFDCGNSPVEFTPERCAGRTLLMSTTNGTRALARAARGGTRRLFASALVNAAATAEALAKTDLDLTLVCSGTDGLISMEDLLGAGAIIHALESIQMIELASDVALIAHRLFASDRDRLPEALANTRGGRNIRNAGLTPDISFAARLNAIPVVVIVDQRTLTIFAAASKG